MPPNLRVDEGFAAIWQLFSMCLSTADTFMKFPHMGHATSTSVAAGVSFAFFAEDDRVDRTSGKKSPSALSS